MANALIGLAYAVVAARIGVNREYMKCHYFK